MSQIELTDDDCYICLSALKYYIEFVDDYIKYNRPVDKQAYSNKILANETIQFLENHSEMVRLSNIRITVAALSLLKEDVNFTIYDADATPDDISESKSVRKMINHAIRYFRAICESQDIDFDCEVLHNE